MRYLHVLSIMLVLLGLEILRLEGGCRLGVLMEGLHSMFEINLGINILGLLHILLLLLLLLFLFHEKELLALKGSDLLLLLPISSRKGRRGGLRQIRLHLLLGNRLTPGVLHHGEIFVW